MLNPYNNSFSEQDLAEARAYLKAKGVTDAQAADILGMMRRGDVEMSKSDGVTMVRNEPDAPGAYVDAYQQLQDAYTPTVPEAPAYYADGRTRAAGFFPTTADMNTPVVPMANPNARVEIEGQRTTVSPNGTVVIY